MHIQKVGQEKDSNLLIHLLSIYNKKIKKYQGTIRTLHYQPQKMLLRQEVLQWILKTLKDQCFKVRYLVTKSIE